MQQLEDLPTTELRIAPERAAAHEAMIAAENAGWVLELLTAVRPVSGYCFCDKTIS